MTKEDFHIAMNIMGLNCINKIREDFSEYDESNLAVAFTSGANAAYDLLSDEIDQAKEQAYRFKNGYENVALENQKLRSEDRIDTRIYKDRLQDIEKLKADLKIAIETIKSVMQTSSVGSEKYNWCEDTLKALGADK
jgi:hypothetical protein